jgi:predicted Zn-dependent protease
MMSKHFLTAGAFGLCLALNSATAAPSPQFNLTKIFKTVTDGAKAAKDISESDEIVLGQEVTANLLSLGPLLDNQEVQAYVNKVGRWVSLHSERPDLPWTFVVLDLNDATAFAAPGGYIVITKGLLLKMNSEAELAGVLGHEASHVVRKHHLSAIKKANTTAFLKTLGDTALDASGKDNRRNRAFLEIASLGAALYGVGLDKDSEFEADRMGVVLATRAGYDSFGLPAVLQTLQGSKGSEVNSLVSTHPPTNDRLNQLDRVMGSNFDRFDSLPTVEDRFLKIKELITAKKK